MLEPEDLMANVQVELRQTLRQLMHRAEVLNQKPQPSAAAHATADEIERIQTAYWVLFPPRSEDQICAAEPERAISA